ncbi:MAG: VWA domain-containing protein [Nitrospinaceae bacterium]|nr:VWA domain-containing protein [Nitrospinaceae bacterium]NIR57824.1 VWA domain-containing protein [Nitrospinaceae bacterium]NIS88287.1 VWA domain-containing protein [Nitrospinaceae bacterium]NIT85164.1 VWA domain-containing protein [Nitrospinaceae bacterium]NIU47318.1 VWA domain-containing protein [Nitrospinaceae bacterium]
MRFGEPSFLYLLALLPFLMGFFIWAEKKRTALASQWVSPALLPRLVSPTVREQRRSKSKLSIAGLLFLILALSQPRWGFQWEDLQQRGVDIVVALDVSNSMRATDIKPSRLERARHKIADLLRMLEGDRIGLVAFAGTSFLHCPLTLDYQAAEMFLGALDTDLIPLQGTALGHAIQTSIGAFSKQERKSRALLLITDGEDHAGNLDKAIELARKEEVKIFVIGIGREGGAPVPNPERGGGFKRNRSGEIVMSRINEPLLEKIAVETGGAYVRSVHGDMDLTAIYRDHIQQSLEKKDLKTSRRKRWTERFQWLILAALLCLAGEAWVREK